MLGEYQKPFGKDALFTPRIVTFACENCPLFIRQRDCLSDGKYCPYRGSASPNTMPTDSVYDKKLHALEDLVEDKEIILESLREKCIYMKVLQNDESMVLRQWYNYMAIFS